MTRIEETSRYCRLFELLDGLAATQDALHADRDADQQRLNDFRHMIELFTRRDDTYFARTLGIKNLTGHFNGLEKSLKDLVGDDVVDAEDEILDA